MNNRLIHDICFHAAADLVEAVASCLREEERLYAGEAFYHIVREHLVAYHERALRLTVRLHPGTTRGEGCNDRPSAKE
jgi:hypothetical protein